MAAVVVPSVRIMSNGVSENMPSTSSTPSNSNWSVIGGPPNMQGISSSGQPFLQPYHLRPAYRFQSKVMVKTDDLLQDGPGRRLRKNVANVRKHIDYVSNVLNHIDARLWQCGRKERLMIQPDILYQSTILPPSSTMDTPIDCVCTKFVRAAMNKVKCPIYTICWTPEGKRLITGASSGEFTLWNGTAFNFETILQAHDVAVRALKWTRNDQWMASADHDGFVKYWQPNMNNVHMFQAHKDEPIRGLSFSPTDIKLATASDDGTARIWDFARCVEERILRGHGADVRSVDWHPTKGLLVTGSRDSQQPVKLWDPKTGQCLATLHDHKNSVMAVQWNRNGNWLLTGSRDHLIKLYDIRMMREMQTFRGHKKEVTSLAWHPIHEDLFVSGGGDGSLAYWLVHSDRELALLEGAHDQAVWTMEWHPLGHILATGSNDTNTKFWARNRPGDTQEDIFGLTGVTGVLTSQMQQPNVPMSKASEAVGRGGMQEPIEMEVDENGTAPAIPGMGLDEQIYQRMNRDVSAVPIYANSLPGLGADTSDIGAKRTLIKQPPPKKTQRQFERMWNVAKPNPGDEDEQHYEGPPNGPTSAGFQLASRGSLLGPPPGIGAGSRFPSLPNYGSMPPPPRPLNSIQVPPPRMSFNGPPNEKDIEKQNAQGSNVNTSWRTGPHGKNPSSSASDIPFNERNPSSVPMQQQLPSLPPNFMPPGWPPRFPPGMPPMPPPPGMSIPPFMIPPFMPPPHSQANQNPEDMDFRMVEMQSNADKDFRRM